MGFVLQMQPLRSRGLVKTIQLVSFQMVAINVFFKIQWLLLHDDDDDDSIKKPHQRLGKIQWVQFLLQMIALKGPIKIPWALLQMMASKDRLKIQGVFFQMMTFKRPIEDSMCFFCFK
jgi:hypothetical protein